MKKNILPVIMILVGLIFSSAAYAAEGDKVMTQTVMQKLPAVMKTLQAKAAAKDYFATAEAFMDIARMFKSLDKVVPDSGSKDKWDEIHGQIVNASFMGIGACGAKDDAAIKKAIEELVKYKDKGHKLFIK